MTTNRVLRTITDLQPGDHLGFLYQTEAKHRALLTPFLRQGLERGERVLYIIADVRSTETVLDYLRDDGLEVEPYLASGQLRIKSAAETYLAGGVFNPDDMISFWQAETERALAEGYQALRGAGELTWALQRLPDIEPLFEYESKLSEFLPGTKCLLICLYDEQRLDSKMVINMLATHPAAALGTEIYGDFYYLPPADRMRDGLPLAILRYWLERLAERRRAEEALEENRRRLQAIFDNALNAILLADDEMHYVDANPAACALLGYSREELLRLTIIDVTPPQNRAPALEAWQAFMAEGKQSGEFILLRQDGTTVEGEFRAVANIMPGLHLSVLHDISKRKQAEAALNQQKQILQTIFDHIPVMITFIDSAGRIILVNREWERVLGWSLAEVQGREMLAEFYPDPKDRQVVLNFIQTARRAWRDFKTRTRDGRVIDTSWAMVRLADGTNIGIGQDITNRKQAEAELHRYATQMEAQAKISQALTEAGLDVQVVLETIVRHTAEIIGDVSRITLLSDDEQWFQPVAFHHPKPEVRGLMASLYLSTPIAASQEWMAHILRTGQPVLIPIVPQEQLRQIIQPEYLPFVEQVGFHSILIVPLHVEGRVIGTLGLTRDRPGRPYTPDDQVLLQDLADRAALTIQNARLFEQVQGAHEELQVLSRRLLEVQEAERRHIARELHDEIGQALTGLKLLLDMSARGSAKTVKSRLGEAQALVDELMERVDELSLDLRPAMLDDLGLLPTLLGHFERYTHQTNIRVTFKQTGLEGRRFSPNIETTVYRLIQEALTNVARHAGVGEVTVRLWVSQDTLGVEIEDPGTGFDPRAAGASPGLSGMRERVVLSGGQLTIESSSGSGTSITAELPLPGPPERGQAG